MPAPLRLEVFETAALPEEPALLMPEEVEDLRLTAYERGYVAGWEDAGRQAEAERGARQALVAARIEALTFAYHEARAHVLDGLAPLLQAILVTILPAVARGAVVPLVIDELLPAAAGLADRPLVLRIPPGWRADYEAALAGLVLPPLTLHEDPALAETQAEIVAAEATTRIDLAAALARIEAALAAFHTLPEQEKRLG
jgi:flagellar assembly protein FliH